jgi:hypothetical protein
MTNRAILAPIVLIIFPLGLATGLLATHTIGESISPSNSAGIGFAVGLLAAVTAAYVFFFSSPAEATDARFSIVLVVCGTVCIVLALGLQFYLASLAGENSRRFAEMVADAVKRGERMNANWDLRFPDSVKGIAYLSLFAGIWLAAMGIRFGAARGHPAVARPVAQAWPIEDENQRSPSGV